MNAQWRHGLPQINQRICFGILILAVASVGSMRGGDVSVLKPGTTVLSGNPPICPRWALRPWVWEDNDNTQKGCEGLVKGYLSRDIPVGVVVIYSPWETAYNSLAWDRMTYPDPQTMINQFHAKGIKVLLWLNGFLSTDSPDYEYVRKQGYATDGGRRRNWWQGSGVHLDFTNTEATQWWHRKMDGILRMGIDGWKVDQSAHFLEETVRASIGTMTKNQYKPYYYADIFDHTVMVNPDAAIAARAFSEPDQGGFAAPTSKCTVTWGGDHHGDWAGLDRQLEALYRAAEAGYGAPCLEVGGSLGAAPTKDELIRQVELGAFMPVMSNGGVNGGLREHLPWFHDEQTVQVYRYYATLHSELVPYIFSYSVESNLSGISIVRQPDKQRRQHFLGEQLFVSTITTRTEEKEIVLPDGMGWIDYWNEDGVYPGGSTIIYKVPLERYPLFIEAGSIIPMAVETSITNHGDETSTGKQTLLIYPFGKSSFVYHRPTGEGVEYSDVTIQVDEVAGCIQVAGTHKDTYRIRVKSFRKPKAVEGADSWYYDERAGYVVADKEGTSFHIKISGLSGYFCLLSH